MTRLEKVAASVPEDNGHPSHEINTNEKPTISAKVNVECDAPVFH